MKRTILALAAGALVAAGVPAHALTSTCTFAAGDIQIVAHVPSTGDFNLPAAEGRTLTVDIDPATGGFTLHRSTVAPLSVDTPAGPVDLHLEGPDAVGSIDAAGEVTILQFPYIEYFASQPLPETPTLTTGANVLSGVDSPVHGKALDFTTGHLTLEGAGHVPNAPLVSEPVVSGLSLNCRLDPIPPQASLPKAAALKGASGTAKIGTDGDRLTFKAVVAQGAIAAGDLTKADVAIAIRGGGTAAPIVVFVGAGDFQKKGRKFVVKDTDGTKLQALAGRKDAVTATSGNISITGGKHAKVALKIDGLDTTVLSGPLDVTVTLGSVVATSTATASGNAKRRHFH